MTVFSKKLKKLRKVQKLTQAEFAEKCAKIDKRPTSGWTQPRVATYEKGSRTPDIEDIKVMSIALEVDPVRFAFDTNYSTENFENTYYYPVLTTVQAGRWTGVNMLNSEEGFEMLSTETKASKDSFFIVIEGDSMSPRFTPGDILLIDPEIVPQPGKFVVASNEFGDGTFKKYRELAEFDEFGHPHFELVPINDAYPTLSSKHHKIRIVGVAKEKREQL